MTIPKERLEKLIAKYENQAARQFDNFQQTGITRYETAYRSAEDLADTLRMALNASDEHTALLHYRGQLSIFAGDAVRADTPEKKERVLKNLISFARMQGLIGAEEKLPEVPNE